MLTWLQRCNDVLAFKVSDTITGVDLDAVMDGLDEAMASPGKVHLFIETQAVDRIELSGLARYVGRAMPLFSKLTRFGRVAVVSDQAWVRFGTRLESALLPHVRYRVFMPPERDDALAWVQYGGE